ncbi:MAG: HAMP domain-containing histidine kinase, partial [Faecalibacterium sp.]|nr:HAMP domain-containing histidine kinase [Faecalibacterium sp.]
MKWMQTRAGKAIAAVLFTLACFVAALCCAGMIGAAQMECYTTDSYYNTNHYYQVMEWHANDLMSFYAEDWLQSEKDLYEAGNTNLRFRISTVQRDGTIGSELLSNMDNSKTRFGCWYLFVVQPDGGYASRVMERAYGEFVSKAAASSFEIEQKVMAQRKQAWTTLVGQLPQQALPTATVYQLELYATDPITVQGQGYYQNSLYNDSHLFNFLYPLRYTFALVLAVCAVAALILVCLLFAGTGRYADRPGQVVFGWYDRIPMELSFTGSVALGALAALLVWEGVPSLLNDAFYWVGLSDLVTNVLAISGLALVFTLWVDLLLAWLLAWARAAKSGQAFRHFGCVRLAGWLFGAVRQLPLVPKVAMMSVGLVGVTVLEFLLICSNSYIRLGGLTGLFLFLFILLILLWPAALAYIIYGAVGMKKLNEYAQTIAQGDYRVQIDTHRMPRHLCGHAETLENIAAGLNRAVEERTKSERMKTELITNVSHDLKTPLTSIINSTDLLQSQPWPEQAAEDAAVLARQSARLKKLTEDLVEASKASSGAMNCEKRPTDLAELCAQALGEYTARLEDAGLTPVLTMPEAGLWGMADGRLVWRVLDNLLGNACKYVQPGTRLYLAGS